MSNVDDNGVVTTPKKKKDPEFIIHKEWKFVKTGYETPAGKKMQPVYKEVYNEEKKKKIVTKVGMFNLYEDIQMSSNGSEIELLKRQAMNSGVPIENDPNLVEGVNQTLFPSDIHEAMKHANNVSEAFGRLPEDLQKELFNGNANEYLAAVMDNTVGDKINNFYTEKAAVAKTVTEQTGGAE